MSRSISTAEILEEAMEDFTWMYSNDLVSKKSKKKGTNVRLHPLESASPVITQSAESFSRRRNLQDVHYLSHLQHRAANVNRDPIAPHKKSPQKLVNLSTEEIAQNIEKVQLQTLQESEILKKVTNSITMQFTALDEVAKIILSHRKELASKIEEINQNYVDLFEHMLSEVMRMQRAKFKSQTSLIDDLKVKLDSTEGKLFLEKEKNELLEGEKKKLQEKQMGVEADNRSYKYQIESLQRQIESHIEDKERIITESKKAMSKFREEELVATIENYKQTFKHQLATTKAKHGEELSKLRKIIEDRDNTIKDLEKDIEMKVAEHKHIFKQLEEAQFKRPQTENSTQTQATEEGLWDHQDGWVLPVSNTTLARNRWRKAINFVCCPACKGNSQFIAQTALLFKQVTVGIAPTELVEDSTINEDSARKWIIPDNLTAFLANLPKSVQAWNPHGLSWTVKMTYLLLDYRSIVDAECRKLGYRIENFMDYTIETFLRNVENRSQAELNLYQYIRSLREHYTSHQLLHLAARCLHLSHALSNEDKQKIIDLRTKGELALKRKRKAHLLEMKARERTKVVTDRDKEGDINPTPQIQGSMYEKDYNIHEDILSKEILAAILFVRKCLYSEPYNGVYRKQMVRIKEACTEFKAFENSLAKLRDKILPTGSPPLLMPSHVIFNVYDKFQTYIPVDRAVRVIKPLLSGCSPSEVLGIYRALEYHCRILFDDGKIMMPDGMHSFVRSTIRLFIYAENGDGSDIDSWQKLKDRYSHTVNNAESKYDKQISNESASKNKKEIILHEDTEKYTLVISADYLLLLVSEIWRRKLEIVDQDLRRIFELGDVNKDNVLSFIEFKSIVQKVYKGCEERKVLRMFREALLLGNDKDTIGPQSFLKVCKEYDLVNMMDFAELEAGPYQALLCPVVNSEPIPPPSLQPVLQIDDELGDYIKEDCKANFSEKGVQTEIIALEIVEEQQSNLSTAQQQHNKQSNVPRRQSNGANDKKLASKLTKEISTDAIDHSPVVEESEQGGDLGVKVSQKPLILKKGGMQVNVAKSKEYSEQIQRDLLQRKLHRMQVI